MTPQELDYEFKITRQYLNGKIMATPIDIHYNALHETTAKEILEVYLKTGSFPFSSSDRQSSVEPLSFDEWRTINNL